MESTRGSQARRGTEASPPIASCAAGLPEPRTCSWACHGTEGYKRPPRPPAASRWVAWGVGGGCLLGPKACTHGLPAAVKNTGVMHALPEPPSGPPGVLLAPGGWGQGHKGLVWCESYPGHEGSSSCPSREIPLGLQPHQNLVLNEAGEGFFGTNEGQSAPSRRHVRHSLQGET